MSNRLSIIAMALAGCVSANAIPLYVSGNGQFSSSDTLGQLVAPNGLFSFTFVIDNSPVPVSGTVTSTGFDVPVSLFSYNLNGASVNAQPSEIRFATASNGGLYDVTFGSGLSAAVFSFQGPQIFSGTTAAPSFSTGSYNVSAWTYSDLANYDSQQPVSLTTTVSNVPEPSSILLTLCGMGVGLILLIGQLKALSRK